MYTTSVFDSLDSMNFREIVAFCPLCNNPVIVDYACEVTHADNMGEPVEETKTGYYCTNEKCHHSIEPFEMDELFYSQLSHAI